MLVNEVHWWTDPVRSLFGFLDQIVYNLIQWVLYGVFDLSKISTNTDVFNNIYQRIYIVLGVFMAFKLSFSFFQYIISPDDVNGKNDKSVSKIFSRVIIMLGALILLPTLLFGRGTEEGILSRAQNAFLPMLPRIIFGTDGVNGTKFTGDISQTVEEASREITVTTLSGFFRPSEELDSKCGPGSFKNTPEIKSLSDFSSNITKKCAIVYYRYSYSFGISTIVGVLVLALFLGITLDIAKRIFKLLVLEIIAPIPIMSLIDPKGKDRAFEHWSKSLMNTFLDIFFKMGLLYLIIVLIHMIVQANASGGLFKDFPQLQGFRGVYLTIFLILGLIFFAKEAPKFIKEAMGIKDSGGGLFDDVKSLGKAAGLVGGAAMGTAGIVGSTVGNVRAQMEGNKEFTPGHHIVNSLKNIGAGISGFVGGTASAVGALTKKDANMRSVMKAQQDRNSRSFDYRRNGGTLFGGLGQIARGSFTGETAYDALERKWKKQEEDIKADELNLKTMQDVKAREKNVMDRVKSKTAESLKTTGNYGGYTGNWRKFDSAHEAAKSGIGIHTGYRDSSGNVISSDAYNSLNATQKANYTEGTYFTSEGQEVNMEEAKIISQGLFDSNQEDYYSKAYSTREEIKESDRFDPKIAKEMEAIAEAGKSLDPEYKLEADYSGFKGKYGELDEEIVEKSNSINKSKEEIHKERQDKKSASAQANSSTYKAGKK